MAIYGIGSCFGASEEKLSDFINTGHAFVGWSENDAPAIVQSFKSLKPGDIVYVKSNSPRSGLYIKAVGVVTGREAFKDNINNLGWGRKVRWAWWSKLDPNKEGLNPVKLGKIHDGATNMRTGTFYEEFGPEIQEKVLDLLINGEILE